jgi:alpha-tubulin suppressor-like RCC1 family protein
MRYIEAKAGGQHSASLSEDGDVILTGNDTDGQCAYPGANVDDYISVLDKPVSNSEKKDLSGNKLEEGFFVKVITGKYHTVALQADGCAVAIGDNSYGQCDVPDLPYNVATGSTCQYIDAAAGRFHTVLLRDDGVAVAFGENRDGQCDVPPSKLTDFCVDVAAGDYHTLLLHSNGEAKAFGRNTNGQCNVPVLPEGLRYGNPIVNISAHISYGVKRSTGDLVVQCHSNWSDTRFEPAEVVNLRLDPELPAPCMGEVRKKAAEALKCPLWSIRLFDEDGRLLPFDEDEVSVLDVFSAEDAK